MVRPTQDERLDRMAFLGEGFRVAAFRDRWRFRILGTVGLSALLIALTIGSTRAQRVRKSPRARPPTFDDSDVDGIYYEDLRSRLTGRPPRIDDGTGRTNPATAASSTASDTSSGESEESQWVRIISADSLEDLAKSSKLRVDRLVTSPARYAGGAYAEARREFALLTIVFGIVEQYDQEVRWQETAMAARQLFSRAAENSRKGDSAAFNDARSRKQDLADLLRGSSVESNMPETTLEWSESIDRDVLMELLEWSLRDQLQPALASESDFETNAQSIRRDAELIRAMGAVATADQMPDADDEEYMELARQMMLAAGELTDAVESNRWQDARAAFTRVDQSCNACHETYR